MYDVVIVGGGPTGLTLATYLPGKIALLERQPVLGGCHRYDSKTYSQFAEHGPRVYSGAYVNVKRVLHDIGLKWDDVFVRSSFSPELIDGKRWYQWLSVREIWWLGYEYMVFLMRPDHGKNISMATYCTRRGFRTCSSEYIDTVCRFSDGAGAKRYSLWEFLSGFDQHVAPFYLPRQPLDGTFRHWHSMLTRRGVDVFLEANVTAIVRHSARHSGTNSVTVTMPTSTTTLRAKKIVLCIPPVHAASLLKKSNLSTPRIRAFARFARRTRYDPYWSVSFFDTTVPLSQRSTPWGIIAVQYPFGVVSAAATRFHVPSPATGKTLAESSNEDAVQEIKRQLGLGEDVRHAYVQGRYVDQSFVAAAGRGYFAPQLVKGIDVVGCHNGRSTYHFTSMESAVQNALAYAGVPTQTAYTMGGVLSVVLLIVILGVIVKMCLSRDSRDNKSLILSRRNIWVFQP